MKIQNSKFKIQNYGSGFSALEIVIVIAVLAILAVVGFVSLSSSQNSLNLNRSAEDVRSLLLQARSKTLAGEGGLRYGVHFEADKATLFGGDLYAAVEPPLGRVALPSSIEISAITLTGGGSDALFKRLTGETDNDGTVTVRNKTGQQQTRIVRIRATGTIRVE